MSVSLKTIPDKTKDVYKCKTDNDCYAVPGWPTAAEKTKTCCARIEVTKYDTANTNWDTLVQTLRTNSKDDKYTVDAIGTVYRQCETDYPTDYGATNFDQKTHLTVDSQWKSSGQ